MGSEASIAEYMAKHMRGAAASSGSLFDSLDAQEMSALAAVFRVLVAQVAAMTPGSQLRVACGLVELLAAAQSDQAEAAEAVAGFFRGFAEQPVTGTDRKAATTSRPPSRASSEGSALTPGGVGQP